MIKKHFLLVVMVLILFLVAGCEEKITGEFVTKGKVVLVGNKAIQQEKKNGKSEYVDRITNLSNYRSTLVDAMNKGKEIKIFWTAEKGNLSGVQNNTIKKIE